MAGGVLGTGFYGISRGDIHRSMEIRMVSVLVQGDRERERVCVCVGVGVCTPCGRM